MERIAETPPARDTTGPRHHGPETPPADNALAVLRNATRLTVLEEYGVITITTGA